MRRQSIFQSTKVVAQATASTIEELAHLSTDLVRLGRQEVRASASANKLENTLDFVSDKTDGLTELFSRLATLETLPESQLRDMQIAMIKQAIASVEACEL